MPRFNERHLRLEFQKLLKPENAVFPVGAGLLVAVERRPADKRSNVDIDLAGSNTPFHLDRAFATATPDR